MWKVSMYVLGPALNIILQNVMEGQTHYFENWKAYGPQLKKQIKNIQINIYSSLKEKNIKLKK